MALFCLERYLRVIKKSADAKILQAAQVLEITQVSQAAQVAQVL